MQNLHQEIARIAEQQRQEAAHAQREAVIDISAKMIGAMFDKSIAYTNVIIIAGYVGIFTVWSFTRALISERASVTVALLVSFSIFVFAAWEIIKMIYGGFALQRMSTMISPQMEPDALMAAFERIDVEAKRSQIKLASAWLIVLILTIVPAFGAGVLLMYNFIARLTGLPGWPV